MAATVSDTNKQPYIDQVHSDDKGPNGDHDVEADRKPSITAGDSTMAKGTAQAEAMRLVWGRNGLKIVWFGMILMLIV